MEEIKYRYLMIDGKLKEFSEKEYKELNDLHSEIDLRELIRIHEFQSKNKTLGLIRVLADGVDLSPQDYNYWKIHDKLPDDPEVSAWKAKQEINLKAEKYDNKIQLAYYYKEKHGKKVRNIPVSCPRRLVDQITKEAQEKLKEKYVPATKKLDI